MNGRRIETSILVDLARHGNSRVVQDDLLRDGKPSPSRSAGAEHEVKILGRISRELQLVVLHHNEDIFLEPRVNR